MLDRPSGNLLLDKTADIETVADDVVEIVFEDSDYDVLTPGVYFIELYELQTPLKIANGYATLGHGMAAA